MTEKVQAGSLNLTQLIKVGQCIKQEQKAGRFFTMERSQAIFEQIENKTIFETEKVLAIELDFAPKKHQKLTPQKDGSVSANIVFTADEFDLIQKVQSLISHSVPSNDLAKTFVYLAQKQIHKAEGKTPPRATRSFLDSRLSRAERVKRRHISLKIRRRLLSDAMGECTYVGADLEKCRSRFCLQIDHIKPLARGGTDDIQNLRVLCGYHNRAEARRWNIG